MHAMIAYTSFERTILDTYRTTYLRNRRHNRHHHYHHHNQFIAIEILLALVSR